MVPKICRSIKVLVYNQKVVLTYYEMGTTKTVNHKHICLDICAY